MSNSFDEARIDELHAELQRSEPADMLHKYDALLETALKNAIGVRFLLIHKVCTARGIPPHELDENVKKIAETSDSLLETFVAIDGMLQLCMTGEIPGGGDHDSVA